MAQRKTGVVRIATTQVLTWVLLPPAFTAFHAQWPETRVEPIDIPTDQILHARDNGQADLAINFDQPVGEHLEALDLFDMREHLICAGYVKPISRVHDLRAIPLVEPDMLHRFMLYRNRSRSITPAVQEHQKFLLEYFGRTRGRPVEDVMVPRWAPR